MDAFLKLISDPAFLDILKTYGLGVLLVLYFVFVRDPKNSKYWRKKYDELSKNYNDMRENYKNIEASLHPEKREMSLVQATKLCHLALDRDLYKFYRRICEKLDGFNPVDVSVFLEESILDTNETWSHFRSPFPKVRRISDLYGVYQNKGGSLKGEIDDILENGHDKEETKKLIWNKLLENTVKMKREFIDNLKKLEEGEAVEPFRPGNGKAEAAAVE